MFLPFKWKMRERVMSGTAAVPEVFFEMGLQISSPQQGREISRSPTTLWTLTVAPSIHLDLLHFIIGSILAGARGPLDLRSNCTKRSPL
jgi:hypothetical protein